MSTPLVNAIAAAVWGHDADLAIEDATIAAAACIAVVGAMPADYTAVDVLAALCGEDVPSEPLPAKAGAA